MTARSACRPESAREAMTLAARQSPGRRDHRPSCRLKPLHEIRHAVLERRLRAGSRAAPHASVVSAKQCRMSPARYCAVYVGLDSTHRGPWRAPRQRRRPRHGAAVPRLIAPPGASSEPRARMIPSTMSETWMKSRDCRPSSKITGGLPVEKPRREDRGDSGVGVRERLSGPVDVEEAKSDGRNSVGCADDKAQLLVVPLANRVDRRRDERLGLGASGSERARAAHAGQRHSHSRAASCSSGRGPTTTRTVLVADVLPLAVDRHRGGDDEPLHRRRGARRCARGTSRSPSCSSVRSGRSRTSTAPTPTTAARCTTRSMPGSARSHHRRGQATSPTMSSTSAGSGQASPVVDLRLEAVKDDDVVTELEEASRRDASR